MPSLFAIADSASCRTLPLMTTRCASLNGSSQARLSRVRPQASRRKDARKAALRAAAEKTKESGRATEAFDVPEYSVSEEARTPNFRARQTWKSGSERERVTTTVVQASNKFPAAPLPMPSPPPGQCQARQISIDTNGLYDLMSDAGMLGVLTEEGVTSLDKFRNGLVVLAEDQKRGRMSSLRPGHLSAAETIQPAAGNEGSSQYTTTYMAQSQSTTAPRKAQGKRMVNTQQSHTRATSLGSFAGFATPVRDPVKDIQELQQGTTKASQHLPGYTGHISKQTSANQPTVVRDLDKSAPLILHNFHPVCPGPARVVSLRAAATEVEPKTQSTTVVGPSSGAPKAELPDVQPSTLEVQRFLNTLVTETSIAEMHLQVGNFELRVRRSTKDGSASSPVAPQQTVVITTPAPTPMETLKSLEESMDESLVPILSPKVGIFRRGKYAAGKRIGKGNAVNEVGAAAVASSYSGSTEPVWAAGIKAACRQRQGGEQVKRGQVLGYVEQLGTFVPVERSWGNKAMAASGSRAAAGVSASDAGSAMFGWKSPQAGEAVKFLIADGSPVEYRQEVVDLAPFFGGHIIGDSKHA
ncbi:hypothetical protein QJQ45_004142 [Haematococcus lacustris]|nr:hypothetical protein QJQ45_004142 [Haematococcus lacustris]